MLEPVFEDRFVKQLKQLRQDNKRLAVKTYELITDACLHPFTGLGKPEPLKGNRQGQWSRHIDQKNRLIYRVIKPNLICISCIGHYDDK
jgi:toxin YoeB